MARRHSTKLCTFVKDNTVENEYVEAVIECVNKYGPYIVIVPGIAMPHSTEGAVGCNGTAISFMKVEEEVDFDPEDPDKKAKIVLLFSSN